MLCFADMSLSIHIKIMIIYRDHGLHNTSHCGNHLIKFSFTDTHSHMYTICIRFSVARFEYWMPCVCVAKKIDIFFTLFYHHTINLVRNLWAWNFGLIPLFSSNKIVKSIFVFFSSSLFRFNINCSWMEYSHSETDAHTHAQMPYAKHKWDLMEFRQSHSWGKNRLRAARIHTQTQLARQQKGWNLIFEN